MRTDVWRADRGRKKERAPQTARKCARSEIALKTHLNAGPAKLCALMKQTGFPHPVPVRREMTHNLSHTMR